MPQCVGPARRSVVYLGPVSSARYWLIDLPARITEVGFAWYRLYFLVVLWAVALIAPVMALTTLVLWFGFGIRWGWSPPPLH